jgi:hypothetical protein
MNTQRARKRPRLNFEEMGIPRRLCPQVRNRQRHYTSNGTTHSKFGRSRSVVVRGHP